MTKENESEDLKDLKEEDFLPDEPVGQRHLIECNCILPMFKNREKPIWHKFPVFSIINEKNEVEEKFAQCNNCGIIHKIKEIGVSEVTTKEKMKMIRSIDDIRIGIPPEIGGLLEQYKCDVSVWEEVEFILQYKKWGSIIVLESEKENGEITGKALIFQGTPVLAKIESFRRQEIVK